VQTRRRDIFTTIRTEGGVLPADLLQRIAAGDKGLEGLDPASYHLVAGEKINEVVNRAWNALTGKWQSFRAVAEKLPEGDPGTTATRDRWLLPLFQELGYGRLQTAKAIEIDDRSYPVSHGWQNTPIHLVGCNVDLDRRTPGVPGATRTTPHGLVQELLNRSDASIRTGVCPHLWAFVSNGKRLRILRDNKSLTRQSYVEFDLESMFEGEVYADFVMLWLLCHQSRVEGERPEQCWLEKWSRAAQEQGTRALEQLRVGVERAIAALGSGFLAHPENRDLREKLRTGGLGTHDYYRQLLRLVYRLLFLFVAEDRDLLLDPNADEAAKDRYLRFYATGRLRRLAERQRGTRHGDLYACLRLVMQKLGDDHGCPKLGLPALGSFLFSSRALPDIESAEISNGDFLTAVRELALMQDASGKRLVDFKNLRSEELGSVYEALLEQHPEVNIEAPTFALRTASGSERKTTGSYYTPDSLVQCLLDSALDPVLAEAAAKPNPEKAILTLKVCDPACGSGHFLIAAAHRIAKRLASVRTGDEEPSPEATRHALRDVIGGCIYGVDLNPMALELCKVALWMEALEPGKPLSFLDHHLQCGNSLLGATPALLAGGIPDAAFTALADDDEDVCAEWRKHNRKERADRDQLALDIEPFDLARAYSRTVDRIGTVDDTSIAGIHRREAEFECGRGSDAYERSKLWADAWCAAFVWKRRSESRSPYPLTQHTFALLASSPDRVAAGIRAEIRRLAEQYSFMHWHLAFPDVFRLPGQGETPDSPERGWSGGFDVMLGNPPWERVTIQEKEWFSARRPDIAGAPNASKRRRMIQALASEDAELYSTFVEELRVSGGIGHLLRDSGRYPLCGRGDVNTYAVFAELMRTSIAYRGRAGYIVQSDIATGDTYKEFFGDLLSSTELVSLFDFVNTEGLFQNVHRTHPHFCLLTVAGSATHQPADFAFWNTNVGQLRERERHFCLTEGDVSLLNPNTLTCPVFRSQRDAELTKKLYSRVRAWIVDGLAASNPWTAYYLRLVHFSDHAEELSFAEDLIARGFVRRGLVFESGSTRMLPLYEPKLMDHFDHRFATFEGVSQDELRAGNARDMTGEEHCSPDVTYEPRYWISEALFNRIMAKYDYAPRWFFGYREITNSTNARTLIASIVPFFPATLRLTTIGFKYHRLVPCLAANFAAFALDYVARQKMGGAALGYYMAKQLPVLAPTAYAELAPWARQESVASWIMARLVELIYTAYDMAAFAAEFGCFGPPYEWREDRRFLLRAELDAAFFQLYGAGRDDVDYIMDTFPIVKRKDEAAFEEYRTKRVILEIYDEMQTAMETGVPYQTRLDPPPANGWVPPTELLQFEADAATEPALPGREEDIGAGAVREQRAQYGSAGNASDLELVAPPSTPLTEPVPALDISTGEVKTDWSTRVRVNGKLGFLISEGTAPDGSRIVTVQLDGDEKPRKFVSPPALVERLG
jgi:hypothetical protein